MDTEIKPEFSKDRLNQEIRGLMRENSQFKNLLFNKDKEVVALQEQLKDANSTIDTLSVMLGVVLLLFITGLLFAVTQWR